MADPALKLVDKDGMDKSKALDSALQQIERSYGKGSIMKLGEGQVDLRLTRVVSPTGIK